MGRLNVGDEFRVSDGRIGTVMRIGRRGVDVLLDAARIADEEKVLAASRLVEALGTRSPHIGAWR